MDKNNQLLVRSVLRSANSCAVDGDPEINLRAGDATEDELSADSTEGLGVILTGEPGTDHSLAETQGSMATSNVDTGEI